MVQMLLNQIIDVIRHEGGNIASITNSNESTLEDVFLAVTGKEIRDQATGKAASHYMDGEASKSRIR